MRVHFWKYAMLFLFLNVIPFSTCRSIWIDHRIIFPRVNYFFTLYIGAEGERRGRKGWILARRDASPTCFVIFVGRNRCRRIRPAVWKQRRSLFSFKTGFSHSRKILQILVYASDPEPVTRVSGKPRYVRSNKGHIVAENRVTRASKAEESHDGERIDAICVDFISYDVADKKRATRAAPILLRGISISIYEHS